MYRPARRRPSHLVLVAVAVAAALIAALITLVLEERPRNKPAPAPEATRVVAADAPTVGPYVVSGNVLLDGQGRPFFIHGVDRPSLEWSCAGQSLSGKSGIPKSDFAEMAAWGANAVRLALNQDYWLSAKGIQVAPGEACPGYVATIKKMVKEIEADGMAVILDLHDSDPGNPTRVAGAEPMPDEGSVRFWRSVAKDFAGNWNVFFELFNEPHSVSWSTWRNGGQVTSGQYTYQAVGMQELVDAVRGVGAHNVIIADGPDFASTLEGLPGHLLSGGGIAYAVHPYAGIDGTLPSTWEKRFGFLTDKQVVVATEFGDQKPGVTRYDQQILAFFRTHGMGWTAWAWWNGGYKFPSLVSGPGGMCVDAGCADRAALLAFARGKEPMIVPKS